MIADGAGEFADAVLRLLADRAERERVALRGREVLERLYTKECGWRQLDEAGVFLV